MLDGRLLACGQRALTRRCGRDRGQRYFGCQLLYRYKRDIVLINHHLSAAIGDFVRMCRRAGIDVVRLGSEYAADEGERVLDLSRFFVGELAPVVACLDAVVAIDSVFGHIAGLSGIPSVTIWGRDTPVRMRYDPAVEASYRPLTMNYCAVPRSGEIGDVTSNRVFHALQSILAGRIRLSERSIAMDETYAGRYTDFG